jgi:hypothetical protein
MSQDGGRSSPNPTRSSPLTISNNNSGDGGSTSSSRNGSSISLSLAISNSPKFTSTPSSTSNTSLSKLASSGGGGNANKKKTEQNLQNLVPLQRPLPRVDSDDKLYNTAVSWEIDPDEIDYEGSARVGIGAHGEVFRAKWRGTPVAVKQVADPAGSSVAEIRHEIAVLAHMHHPRVVQFLGACTKGKPWLVLSEFMKNGSVADALLKLDGERLPLVIAGRWAHDIAQGLRYLHERKPQPVVHRDLKPQNLLIDGSGHVKIADFGLAKVIDQVKLKSMDENYVMTGETGSYRYMAPEVFRHEKYSEKVDVYAFGILLFQFTSPTGAPPMDHLGTVAAAEAMSLRHERPLISPKVSPELKILIQSCWHPDPAFRPSATDCCKKLEELFPESEDEGNEKIPPWEKKKGGCWVV